MQYHVESTHFHSRFYEVLKMGLIFNTLKQTYKHIKRKESINIKLIMKKLCKNEHNMKSPPPPQKKPHLIHLRFIDIQLLVVMIFFWQVDINNWQVDINKWQVNIKIWHVDIIIWQVMADITTHHWYKAAWPWGEAQVFDTVLIRIKIPGDRSSPWSWFIFISYLFHAL